MFYVCVFFLYVFYEKCCMEFYVYMSLSFFSFLCGPMGAVGTWGGTAGRTRAQIDGQTGGRTGGRADGYIDIYLYIYIYIYIY